jgi:hypothetical protein
MKLLTEPYLTQLARWPKQDCHILGQFDDHSIVVYQAYRPSIGHFAAKHGYLGGEFSLNRMSWIKPNFLWMMYRSGWGTKEGQEVILAIWLKRSAFDSILEQAVPSRYVPEHFSNEAAWKQAVDHSNVRLQWDPDHDPSGRPVERRAIQLGLRDEALAHFAHEWIVAIEDISEFAHEQYQYALLGDYSRLVTPLESVYPLDDVELAAKLGLSIIEQDNNGCLLHD